MNAASIFFSYARANSDFVLRLAKDLRADGVSLWLDQLDIAPGERWDVSIQKALERSTTLLIILSPESVASQNVMDEVSFALEESKRVVPVLHKICEVPFRWRRLQHIDFCAGYDTGLVRLLEVLRNGTVSATAEAPAPPTAKQPPTPAPDASSGGFSIGSIGSIGGGLVNVGDVSGNFTGDIVAGDKTTTTTIESGFKQEDDKQQFLQQLDQLRATLRELQAKVQAAPDVSDDVKDEITAVVAPHGNEVKKAQAAAAALLVGAPPPEQASKTIATTLQNTSGALEKVKRICEHAAAIGKEVEPLLSKALPIVAAARHLFGLP